MHDPSQRYASSQHVLYVARTSTQLHLSAHFQPTSPPVYPPTSLPSPFSSTPCMIPLKGMYRRNPPHRQTVSDLLLIVLSRHAHHCPALSSSAPCMMPLKGMYRRNPLSHATVSVLLVAHACRRHVFRPVPRLLHAHHPNSSISRPTCSCLRLPSYDTHQRYASSVYQPTKSPFHGFLATCLDAAPAPSPREDRR